MYDAPKPPAVLAAEPILPDFCLSTYLGYQTALDRTPAATEPNLEGYRNRVVGTLASFATQKEFIVRCSDHKARTMQISGFCPVYLPGLNLLLRIGRHKPDGSVARAIDLEKQGPFKDFIHGKNLFPDLVPMHALLGYVPAPDGGIMAGGCQPVIAHYTDGRFDGAWAIIATELPDFESALESARGGARPAIRLEQLREGA